MGCDSYQLSVYKGNGHWGECFVRFAFSGDYPCLCTFPSNYEGENAFTLNGEHIISLALLGAAVKLAYEGRLTDDYYYIPDCIPEWIIKQIKQHIIT